MGKVENVKRVTATGIKSGNGVLCCQNLVGLSGGSGLRALTACEWAEIGRKSAESDREGTKTVYEPANHGAVRIFSRKEGVLQTTTDSFTPSEGNLRDVNPLSDKDMKNFKNMLEAAYESLNSQAGNGKLHFEPVMVRYRLLDGEGRTIFKSVPQIACGDEGWQLANVMEADVTRRGDEDFTIGGLNMAANAYSLWVELPETGEDSPAKEVVIDMSYPLHPVDFEEDAEIRIAQASGNSPKARIGLPGATSGMASQNEAREERVRKLAARADDVLRPVATFSLGSGRTMEIMRNSAVSVKVVRQIEDKALAKDADEAVMDEWVEGVNFPNGFEARGTVKSGDTTLYFGVTPLGFAGRHPSETVDTGEGEDKIDLRVSVIFCGGKTLSREETITGDFSELRVNPMTGYPSRKAIAEVISASCGGVKKGLRRELLPTEDKSMSIAVERGLKRVKLEDSFEDANETPDGSEMSTERGNLLLCATTGSPRQITGSAETEEAITDCIATERNQGSWDSSRGHFYMSTATGIDGVTANGKTGSINITRLSDCEKVSKMTQGEGETFAATSTGIVRLKGGSVSMFIRDNKVIRAIWLADTGMLLALRNDGSRYLTDNAGFRYDLTKEGDEVCWTGTMQHDEGERPKSVRVGMRAANFDGEVSVTGHGKSKREQIAKLMLNRAVTEPVTIAGIIAPWRSMTGITVKGRQEGHFVLSKIKAAIR